jgi:hypothetical protein
VEKLGFSLFSLDRQRNTGHQKFWLQLLGLVPSSLEGRFSVAPLGIFD